MAHYLVGLSLLIWLPFFRSLLRRIFFLALRVLYVVVLCSFRFCLFFASCFSPPQSLPGDDFLCRLISHPLPSVFFSPIVFVPGLFWCPFLYLVTTAEFVADPLIMRNKKQRVRFCVFFCVWFHLSSSCDIGESGMRSTPISVLGS